MRARAALAAGVVGAAVVASSAVGLSRLRPAEGGDGTAGARPRTELVTVERRTLTDETDVDGTLGYGDSRAVVGRAAGTVTWAPDEGDVVTRGRPLYEVDGRPVPLLYGSRPAYRALSYGSEGADVATLERNLSALGHDPGTVDEDYTAATANAVAAWQADLGVAETGTVGLGDVVVLPAAVRVAGVVAEPGAPVAPGQAVLQVTGTKRVVSVALESALRPYVKEGAAVTVTLPDDTTAKGTVTEIGRVAQQPAGDGGGGGGGGGDEAEPTIAVTVTLSDAKAGGTLDEAPVTVHLTTLERRDVLAVPVAALLALAEGGYAVEAAGGGYVPVKPGVFADGWVEVTGEVSEGMQVVVPA